jgi:hypothetical protein
MKGKGWDGKGWDPVIVACDFRLPFALLVLAGQPAATPKWIYIVAMIMAHGNSAMNPILYGMNNDKFREGYRRVTGCKLRLQSVGNTTVALSRHRSNVTETKLP